MARSRSPNRKEAFEIFKRSQGKLTSREIAKLIGEKEKNIEYWRSADNWNSEYNPLGGAPKGNKNAVGHGAPSGNQNARKEGWYSKYYPTESRSIIKEIEESGGSTIEILWAQIVTLWAAIIRSQKIMNVTDKNEMIKELKKEKSSWGDKSSSEEKEWEFQFAWDRQASFLNAQSRAMAQLTNMIKKYDEMLHNNWDMATEEQKLRIQKLKVQIDNPEFKHREKVSEEKLKLEKERFEHQKKMDDLKAW